MKKLLLFLSPFLAHASICTFVPPEGWECVRPSALSQAVQIGFLGKGQSELRPSLNLATEIVDVSLKDYVKAVRAIHKSELNVKWNDLGEFTFRGGKGRLAEITTPSPFGDIKMLQAIFVKDQTAYILTGASSKEDFATERPRLLAALHSLDLVDDLFAPIADLPKQTALKQLFASFASLSSDEQREQAWQKLQKVVLQEHASLGSYWHFLVLQEGRAKIFPN